MGGISLQIGSIPVFSGAVQVVVLLNQLHELVLDVGELAIRELIFVRTDLKYCK